MRGFWSPIHASHNMTIKSIAESPTTSARLNPQAKQSADYLPPDGEHQATSLVREWGGRASLVVGLARWEGADVVGDAAFGALSEYQPSAPSARRPAVCSRGPAVSTVEDEIVVLTLRADVSAVPRRSPPRGRLASRQKGRARNA